MPIYEYQCEMCDVITEKMQKKHTEFVKCSSCKESCARFIVSKPGYRRDHTMIENTPDEDKLIVYAESGR
jgi:putative FmdB family regulatory protein